MPRAAEGSKRMIGWEGLAGDELVTAKERGAVVTIGVFPARAPVTEFTPLQQPNLFKGFHRAINRGDRDARIEFSGAQVQRFHIGMILGSFEDLRHHTALPRQTQPFGLASLNQPLPIALLCHDAAIRPMYSSQSRPRRGFGKGQ